MQKDRPALILARKHDGHVLEAPPGYSLGGRWNYYFSHLLNCPYDCRYCFLQGMYRSAHYVLFVNFEAYERAIDRVLERHYGDEVYFFSGYDGDSLAFDGVSGFCAAFLPFFAERPRAQLELRSKSARIAPLLGRRAMENCVVAMSFTPRQAWERWERGVPRIERRLEALVRLGRAGWPLGLRFDPLLWWPDCLEAYDGLFEQLFARLDERGRMIGYREELEQELVGHCARRLGDRLAPERLFVCPTGEAAAAGRAAASGRTG